MDTYKFFNLLLFNKFWGANNIFCAIFKKFKE